MRCLVVGQGSIGRRHARLLADDGHEVEVVSRQRDLGWKTHAVLADAWAGSAFDYVVIANATEDHGSTLDAVADSAHRGVVLVEKPVFAASRPLPAHRFAGLYVGYNLRFHPCVRALRRELAGSRVHAACAYAGQYLPTWRPGTDYRESYSASPERGGGVARDLSHELDLIGWLFGPWRRVAALGGTLSSLEIRSDDTLSLLAECSGCPAVQVHLDYLDRRGRRHLIVHHERGTVKADLVAGTVEGASDERFPIERDATYRDMHRAALGGAGASILCQAEDALTTVRVVEAAEAARRDRTWRWL